MRILFTNDDGVFSQGLRALLLAFAQEGNELYVSAPDAERSGASHSFTMFMPLRAQQVTIPGVEDVTAYAVSGTPVDCVKLAYGNLFPRPDLLISGINLGANRGTDIFYSGTVSAAMEGAILGIPSVAVSNIAWKPNCFEAAVSGAKYAASLLMCMPELRLLNVNAPDLSLAQVKGVRFTPAGVQEYETHYDERMDPYGQKYYWLPAGRKSQCDAEADCDEAWTNRGYIVITPIVTNMTDETTLARLRAKQNEITLEL